MEVTEEALRLARQLVHDVPLPQNAEVDAFHIGVATVNSMDYLLTWNCRHLANATLRNRIAAICEAAGYKPPVICTPEELLEGEL